MKKILALALSVVMLASMLLLTGCGGAKTVVGKWEGEMDMTDALTETLLAEDESMAEYFEFEGFKVDVVFDIKDDGTYTFEMTEESMEKAIASLMETMKKGMPAYIEDMVTAMGMTLDDFIAAAGVESIDELIETMLTEDSLDEAFADMESSFEAKYKVEDNKFYSSDDADSDISEDEYMSFELDGNTLTFTELVGAEEDESTVALFVLPLKLTRK